MNISVIKICSCLYLGALATSPSSFWQQLVNIFTIESQQTKQGNKHIPSSHVIEEVINQNSATRNKETSLAESSSTGAPRQDIEAQEDIDAILHPVEAVKQDTKVPPHTTEPEGLEAVISSLLSD